MKDEEILHSIKNIAQKINGMKHLMNGVIDDIDYLFTKLEKLDEKEDKKK